MAEEKGMSAREQAIKAINEGGSVILPTADMPQGKQFNRMNLVDLPSDAEFAMMESTTNPQAKEDALTKLRAEREALDKLEAMLTAQPANVQMPVNQTEMPVEPKKIQAKEAPKKIEEDLSK